MNAWNTLPTEPLPLRSRLPKISAETRGRLLAWGLRQPSAQRWLVERSGAYYLAQPLPERLEADLWDAYALYDAVAALDLLEWQSATQGKVAVDRLEMFDEVAAISKI